VCMRIAVYDSHIKQQGAVASNQPLSYEECLVV